MGYTPTPATARKLTCVKFRRNDAIESGILIPLWWYYFTASINALVLLRYIISLAD